jgi:DNA-binding transcriptional ArsR family regulator
MSGDFMKNCELCEENIIHPENINNVRNKMIDENEVVDLSELFKALCDNTRIKILYALSLNELCVCDIANLIEMSQSAVSHQLRVLRNLRLVKYRKEGKSVYYSLNDQHVVNLFSQGLEHVRHK